MMIILFAAGFLAGIFIMGIISGRSYDKGFKDGSDKNGL